MTSENLHERVAECMQFAALALTKADYVRLLNYLRDATAAAQELERRSAGVQPQKLGE